MRRRKKTGKTWRSEEKRCNGEMEDKEVDTEGWAQPLQPSKSIKVLSF